MGGLIDREPVRVLWLFEDVNGCVTRSVNEPKLEHYIHFVPLKGFRDHVAEVVKKGGIDSPSTFAQGLRESLEILYPRQHELKEWDIISTEDTPLVADLTKVDEVTTYSTLEGETVQERPKSLYLDETEFKPSLEEIANLARAKSLGVLITLNTGIEISEHHDFEKKVIDLVRPSLYPPIAAVMCVDKKYMSGVHNKFAAIGLGANYNFSKELGGKPFCVDIFHRDDDYKALRWFSWFYDIKVYCSMSRDDALVQPHLKGEKMGGVPIGDPDKICFDPDMEQMLTDMKNPHFHNHPIVDDNKLGKDIQLVPVYM